MACSREKREISSNISYSCIENLPKEEFNTFSIQKADSFQLQKSSHYKFLNAFLFFTILYVKQL